MRKAKLPRDPDAPKRNMSAYLLYQNAMRDQFKAQSPGMTFGQLSKYTSVMYAERSTVEKEAWNARAEADRARYLHELSSYVPRPGFDSKGDAVIPAIPPPAETSKKGKRRKPDRDVNAPKRNVSTYLLYQNSMRDQFKAENPGMTFGQLSKFTSHMYKALVPEEKNFWEQKALEDKARFEVEMSNYQPPPGHDAKGNFIMSAMKENKRPRRKPPKDPLAPKRARGSYVFFTYDARPQILREYPDIKFVDLGHVMGERWRALTAEQKHLYERLADQDKIRVAQEMERYKLTRATEDAAAVRENAQLVAFQQKAQLQVQEQMQGHEQLQVQTHEQQLQAQAHEQQLQAQAHEQQLQAQAHEQQLQAQAHEQQLQAQAQAHEQLQVQAHEQLQVQAHEQLQVQGHEQLQVQGHEQVQDHLLQDQLYQDDYQQQQPIEYQQQLPQEYQQQPQEYQQQLEYQQQQEFDPAQYEQIYASHVASHDDTHQYSVA